MNLTTGWSATASTARNPTKHLLYRPSLATVTSHLHASLRELGNAGALLLYVSADEAAPKAQTGSSSSPAPIFGNAWAGGGALMCGSRSNFSEDPSLNTLCVGDLLPLTRRPVLFICEGECSAHFASFCSPFGVPCVALLSPTRYPIGMERQRLVVSPTLAVDDEWAFSADTECFGNLFTLFLTDPVTAVARICKAHASSWSAADAEKAKNATADCLRHTLAYLQSSPASLAPEWSAFAQDDFAALFIAKFALSRAILSQHPRVPKGAAYVPTSCPVLPPEADPPSDLLSALLEAMQDKEKTSTTN